MSVYFVRAGEDGPVKIGAAVNASHRIANLQCGSPDVLSPIRVIEGGQSAERWLHRHFQASHLRGEWFAFDPGMLTVQPPASLSESARTFPIIEKLGGRQKSFERLQAAGLDIRTVHAIRMWIARGQIPGDAQKLLMAECDRDAIAYTAADFDLVDVAEDDVKREGPTQQPAA